MTTTLIESSAVIANSYKDNYFRPPIVDESVTRTHYDRIFPISGKIIRISARSKSQKVVSNTTEQNLLFDHIGRNYQLNIRVTFVLKNVSFFVTFH